MKRSSKLSPIYPSRQKVDNWYLQYVGKKGKFKISDPTYPTFYGSNNISAYVPAGKLAFGC